MARRAFDFYPTPEWATEALVERVSIAGMAFEPCVGDGDIARVLARQCLVMTNDLDPDRQATYHLDARQEALWRIDPQWVVSNPPFSDAMAIVRLAVEHASVGVAMLLRLSFLEPTFDRGGWLAEHPPTRLIVLPRISFTGDGKTDSVTCAWMVWERGATEQAIDIVPRQGEQDLPLPLDGEEVA